MEVAPDERKDAVMGELKRHFKPEFLNRLDDIVIFNPLGQEQLRQIVAIMFEDVRRKLSGMDIEAIMEEEALDVIAKAGFDPVYGARPLKRALYELVEDTLAQMILEEKIASGDRVRIAAHGEEIQISKA